MCLSLPPIFIIKKNNNRRSEVTNYNIRYTLNMSRMRFNSLMCIIFKMVKFGIGPQCHFMSFRERQCPSPLSSSDCDVWYICFCGSNSGWCQITCFPISKLFELPENMQTIGALWNVSLTSCYGAGTTAATVAVVSQMSRL